MAGFFALTLLILANRAIECSGSERKAAYSAAYSSVKKAAKLVDGGTGLEVPPGSVSPESTSTLP
jgi:hypothetical protein